MPKVSVLMPVYNTKEEYLREAIESILNQTFTDFEFIIINDGSTNNSEEVILSYNDKRIKYYRQKNQGIANSLNNGLDVACGEYIARMDSDDISLPTRLEKEVNILDYNPNINIVGAFYEIFPKKNIIITPEVPKYTDLIKSCCIGHPTVMFRQKDFEKYNLRYNPEYKCEDYELWSRAIRYLSFYNIQEVLLRYRWHEDNLSKPTEAFLMHDRRVKHNMLDFLTNDKELKQQILDLLFPQNPATIKYKPLERIFSVKNQQIENKRYKVITILGIKFKFRKYENVFIVRLMGGLGNQMFQYAFGQALEKATGRKVLYDNSWFEESKKSVINKKRENADGVVMREQCIDIFDINIKFASDNQITNCKNKVFETKEFEFDSELLKKRKSAIYEGYFQNEGYLKNIKDQIKKDFQFPTISKNDNFNSNWINRIKNSENPVFVHIRRGDYINLGWDLSSDYYKKAIEYIKEHVTNPTFFIFGQDCEEYIKKEFKDIDANFEIIGEENSKNKEDWKDIVLMEECKHAIIANSSFSWWAAWLSKANKEGIIIAPTPFVNGKDSIICDNWIKIER